MGQGVGRSWDGQGRVFEVRSGKKLYHWGGDAFLEADREEADIVGNDRPTSSPSHFTSISLNCKSGIMFSDSEKNIVAMDLSVLSESNSNSSRFQPRNFRPAKRATTDAPGRTDGQCWMIKDKKR